MEIGLSSLASSVDLPAGFEWLSWTDSLVESHALVKFHCFRDEIDSAVFPCLGEYEGCVRLMREIRRKPGFLPAATWLIASPDGPCGTIQGVMDRGPIGAIQNVGVVPDYRGLGLGRALVQRALLGFRTANLDHAYLEVTADNAHAIQIYRSIGFRKAKTLYKAVERI